ncbi:MAG: BolA/IbaG family iron-sulfur metabolism protein [Gaiellaceae bacterium]
MTDDAKRLDRSFQTDARAKPARPDGGTASGASVEVTERLEAMLREAFPGDEVSVEDRTGGGDHFQVTVISARLDGLTLVEQHRLVYDVLAGPLADGTIHELRIKTRGAAT